MFLVYLDVIVLLGRCCFVSQTMKMKSSHDVLHDPKLSSQPVVETTATEVKVHVTDLFSCVTINNNNNNNNNNNTLFIQYHEQDIESIPF